jgi:hypothetical protein
MSVDISKWIILLNKFIEDVNPKIWNMDTEIFNQQARFREEITKIDNFEWNKSHLVIKNEEKSSAGEDRYSCSINGVSIRFWTSKSKNSVAWSTLRQFLTFSSIFNFINLGIEKHQLKRIKEILGEGKEFKIEFLKVIEFLSMKGTSHYNNWSDFLSARLINCYSTKNTWKNGFFITYIILLLRKSSYAIEFFHNSKVLKNIFKYKAEQGEVKFISTSDVDHFNEYMDKVLKETYQNIVGKVFGSIEQIDSFLKDIFATLLNKEENYEYSKMRQSKLEIGNERSKLRGNILKELNLDEKSYYIDIENYDKGTPMVISTDACHIYEVKEIKNKLRDNKDVSDSDKDSLSDVNNGLLLPKDVHKAFDGQVFSFHYQTGKVIIVEQDLEYIKSLGIQEANIRQSRLNDSMRSYLRKRYGL